PERPAPAPRPRRAPAARPRRAPSASSNGSRRKSSEPVIEPDINAEEVDFAAQTIDDILRILGFDAEISIREPLTPGDGRGSVLAVIDVRGDDLGVLIGRRGDTLMALQYLMNLILARKYPGRGSVTIDIEHYRHRNEERIVEMARRMGEKVRETGNPITLEPMTPAERRIVHLQFVDDPDLETNSIGEGESRKVVISRRNQGG
uniref:Jag family protein n=1 Tax=Tepidiforma sp. TaxID=2682230 RepID=UPI002ADD994C